MSFSLQAGSLSMSNSVYAVQRTSIARHAQTVQVAAQVGLRIGGIDYTNQVALQSTYAASKSVYTTNPSDGLPWSIEGVDSFEGVVKDTSGTTAEMRFTSLWWDVVYSVRDVPQVSLLDPVANESDAVATFTLTLDQAPQETVSVQVATAPASASAPEDFAALQTQVTFDPGQLQATVSVQLNPDALDEDDETFTLELSGAQGLGIADPSGTATITDDDSSPGVTIDDVVVPEGDEGTSPATFTVPGCSERPHHHRRLHDPGRLGHFAR